MISVSRRFKLLLFWLLFGFFSYSCIKFILFIANQKLEYADVDVDGSSLVSSSKLRLSQLYRTAEAHLSSLTVKDNNQHKYHYHYLIHKKKTSPSSPIFVSKPHVGSGRAIYRRSRIPGANQAADQQQKADWKPLFYTNSRFVTQSNRYAESVSQLPVIPHAPPNVAPKPVFEIENPCLPNLLVIGTQKGGTTSFHVYLKNGFHPNILVPQDLKELDFFNKHIERGQQFRKHYLSKFPGINTADDPISGTCSLKQMDGGSKYLRTEATPNYLSHPKAAALAHYYLPQAKVLVMLRNPIKRFISAVNMKWQERLCGSDAWKMPDCYKLHFNDSASQERIKSGWNAQLRETMDEELERIEPCYQQAFSDTGMFNSTRLYDCFNLTALDSVTRWHQLEDHSHVYRSVYVDQLEKWIRQYGARNIRIWSSEEFRRDPESHMQQLLDWFGFEHSKSNLSSLQDQHHTRKYIADIPPDVRERLSKFFAPHNKRLFSLLKRNDFPQETIDQLKKHF